jgi:hypothetical protein
MRREERARILVEAGSRYNPETPVCEDVTVKDPGTGNRLYKPHYRASKRHERTTTGTE